MERTLIRRMILLCVAGFIPFLIVGYFLGNGGIQALSLAYGLSFIFVLSNLLVLTKRNIDDQRKFYKIFIISIAVRFVLVIACIVLVLLATEIDQFNFTVSFIISYICHSVIEIIFLKKILETDTRS